MKIAIIGATGMAGHALVQEFVDRNHEVTAIVRDLDKARLMLDHRTEFLVIDDIFKVSKEQLQGFDVIVNAFATSPKTAYLHIDLAARLVYFFRESEHPRLVFILGAASLKTESGELLLETLSGLPDAQHWISIPENAYKELLFLREVDNVNWVGVSPSMDFVDGEKKDYRTGLDDLLFSSDGRSHVTNRTMAAALADEVENPKFIKTRFTVVDA